MIYQRLTRQYTFYPCVFCRGQYAPDCDDKCDYAQAIAQKNKLEQTLNSVRETIDALNDTMSNEEIYAGLKALRNIL